MKEYKILTKYLFPLMLQITMVALVAVLMRNYGIELSYGSAPGIVLIVLSGISSALWGILYQCRQNNKHFLDIVKDFVHVKQSVSSYLFVLFFFTVGFWRSDPMQRVSPGKYLALDIAVPEGTFIWRDRRDRVEIYLPTRYGAQDHIHSGGIDDIYLLGNMALSFFLY